MTNSKVNSNTLRLLQVANRILPHHRLRLRISSSSHNITPHHRVASSNTLRRRLTTRSNINSSNTSHRQAARPLSISHTSHNNSTNLRSSCSLRKDL